MPTALVTGASTGIGRATALRLAERGWTVLAGVRAAGAGEALRAAAAERGARQGEVIPLTLDVTDSSQIAQAAALVRERTGAGPSSPGLLDGLVNNAGVGIGGPLELIPLDQLRAQFEINVFGQVAVTQALLPALRAASGRIVLLSSIGGRVGLPFNAPYGASKHAIEAIGDALRGELGSSGIHVSLVEPGSVKTPIWEKSRAYTEQLQIPPQLESEYGRFPAAAAKLLQDTERSGIPPERVALTIEHALTARRPRSRYLLGRDARRIVLAKALLPSRAFDRAVRRALGA